MSASRVSVGETVVAADLDAEVAALLRRFHSLGYRQQLAAVGAIGRYLAPGDALPTFAEAAREQAEALELLAAAAAELALPPGTAPTARAFTRTDAARRAGWNATRVARVFGRWNFAVARFLGKPLRQTAAQRAAERAARHGVHRERDDYLRSIRLWLDSEPPSLTTCDYDDWRAEYNEKLADGEPPLVSYSMLRKIFRSSWRDLIEVARGNLSLADAEARTRRCPLARDEGPDQLIGLAEIRELVGLSSVTATRNLTYRRGFPAPVYVHPRGAKQRLWRRPDVEAFLAGRPVKDRSGKLQQHYLDAHAVAEALGLAAITVTTGSSPRVPAPAVRVAGLQLWAAEGIAGLVKRENEVELEVVMAASADGHLQQPQPHNSGHHSSARRGARG